MSHEYNDMTEPEMTEHMQTIGDLVHAVVPPKTAFVVLTTPFMQSAAINYISNADRDNIRAALQELLDRWDNDSSEVRR